MPLGARTRGYLRGILGSGVMLRAGGLPYGKFIRCERGDVIFKQGYTSISNVTKVLQPLGVRAGTAKIELQQLKPLEFCEVYVVATLRYCSQGKKPGSTGVCGVATQSSFNERIGRLRCIDRL